MFVENQFQVNTSYKLLINGFNEIVSGVFDGKYNGKVQFSQVIVDGTGTSLIPGEVNSILRIREDDILSYAVAE